MRLAVLSALTLMIVSLALPANAQTVVETNEESVRASGGTPGSWVQRAITRHTGYIGARVNAARGGNAAGTTTEGTGTTGISSSSTSGLNSLLNLAGLGSLGSLTSSLGSLGSLAGGTSTTTSSDSGTSSSDAGALADLLALRDANTKPSNAQTINAVETGKTATQQSADSVRVGGSAINRLTKPEDRFQTSTTDEPKFVTRWANSMLQSVFSALTFGLQSRDFIDAMKSAIAPLFTPTTTDGGTDNTDNTGNSGDGSGDGTGSNGSNNNGTDSNTGGGIEDLDPSDGSDSDGGSII